MKSREKNKFKPDFNKIQYDNIGRSIKSSDNDVFLETYLLILFMYLVVWSALIASNKI